MSLLHLVQKTLGCQLRVYRYPAPELYDLGVDHLYAPLARHAHPVVAVPHEVRVPDLVEAYGRQLLGPVHHLVYLLPADAEVLLGRQKGPVEVPVTAHAADYLGYRDGSHPQIDLLDSPQAALDFVEGEELVGGGDRKSV